MKRAVFAYSFSDLNAGDFSLNIAAVELLIRNGYFVSIISRFEKNSTTFIRTKKYFKKLYGNRIEMVGSPFRLDRSENFFTKILNQLKGFLIVKSIIKSKEIESLVSRASIVVLCGGNLLRCGSWTDYMRLIALDYPLNLARKDNIPYIIFPQSTAEINKAGEKILKKMIGGSKVTFIREELSYNKLKNMFPTANIEKAIDLAFFLFNEDRFIEDPNQNKIAFTIRADTLGGITEISDSEKESILKKITAIIEQISKRKIIVFVVQGTYADEKLTEQIAFHIFKNNGIKIEIIVERDTFKLIELYSKFDLLIGMRLHSIILAAISGTPSYGLFREEWGLKNPGILQQIALPYGFIDEEDFIEISKIDETIKNRKDFQNRIKNLLIEENFRIQRSLTH